jgi:hypothetical protein
MGGGGGGAGDSDGGGRVGRGGRVGNGGGGGGGGSGSGGNTAPGCATTGNENPVPARVRIRNPARRREFTVNSVMATNMRTRRVTEALTLDGDPPSVMSTGAPKLMCVSWH